jgi:hypothetical protein
MTSICEACEQSPAEIVETGDNAENPYHLCTACHHRLEARALRPVEWYNLAKRHGWNQFLLHDDFYEETGVATQPEEDIENAKDFPAPTLSDVSHDPNLLLDFSITRWHLEKKVVDAWSALQRSNVLVALTQRFAITANAGIRAKVLEICALVLHEHAEEFTRYAWGDYPTKVDLQSLAQASAACLPFREGFDRVVAAVCSHEGARKRDAASCLCYFHTTETLDWIEQNICEPITESWGYLAAASQFDWLRAESWLKRGRPLSLVAIDALLAIARPQSSFLRAHKPRLIQPPTPARFNELLMEYAAKDHVPRVQQRTETLLNHTNTILQLDPK